MLSVSYWLAGETKLKNTFFVVFVRTYSICVHTVRHVYGIYPINRWFDMKTTVIKNGKNEKQ